MAGRLYALFLSIPLRLAPWDLVALARIRLRTYSALLSGFAVRDRALGTQVMADFMHTAEQ
jgi:hypothetical protein